MDNGIIILNLHCSSSIEDLSASLKISDLLSSLPENFDRKNWFS